MTDTSGYTWKSATVALSDLDIELEVLMLKLKLLQEKKRALERMLDGMANM